jgi:hypothetical protein
VLAAQPLERRRAPGDLQGQEGRDERGPEAQREAGPDPGGLELDRPEQRVLGQGRDAAVHVGGDAPGGQGAEPHAQRASRDPDQARLREDGKRELRARGAQRAQQRDRAPALDDRGGERGRHEDHRHEHRHAGERREVEGQRAHEALALLAPRGGRLHREAGGQHGGDPPRELARIERMARDELQTVDAVQPAEELLGQGHVDHDDPVPGAPEALRLEERDDLELDRPRTHHELERFTEADLEAPRGAARQERALAVQQRGARLGRVARARLQEERAQLAIDQPVHAEDAHQLAPRGGERGPFDHRRDQDLAREGPQQPQARERESARMADLEHGPARDGVHVRGQRGDRGAAGEPRRDDRGHADGHSGAGGERAERALPQRAQPEARDHGAAVAHPLPEVRVAVGAAVVAAARTPTARSRPCRARASRS